MSELDRDGAKTLDDEDTDNVETIIEDNNEEDFETYQYYTGMKKLFCRHVVANWLGVIFKHIRYKKLNKVLVKRCVEFYNKC